MKINETPLYLNYTNHSNLMFKGWYNGKRIFGTSNCMVFYNSDEDNGFILVKPDKLLHPPVTMEAYKRFCMDKNLKINITQLSDQFQIQKGDAYFVLRQADMYLILKGAKENGLVIGKDIGIIAYNDIPLYEFVSNGITVMSTDFKKMGIKASEFITNNTEIKEILPTKIIKRNSL